MTAIGALPSQVDLTLYAGDDFTFTLTCSGPAITGQTATAQIRATAANSSVLGAMTTSITAPNIVNLTIPHTVSSSLPATAVWDCQLTDGSGNITTIASGSVTTTPDVTRP